ncbi:MULTISPECIES: PepSY domain-containing protein [unclassified Sphingomonas]|uniref:PepSY domain-containing protein n=1 Tax=unclassified Sphingomonas TaxID=196159 RepID=UPI0012E1F537|nr:MULTISPECIES: PepSY domain-containing protein [unclassified Sphingomonas]
MTKQLAWFHRWLGIVTCLVFALWFASGAVLLFKPFPSLPRGDQLTLERPVAVGVVAVSPAQAMAVAGGGDTLRLVQRGAVPAYIVGTAKGAVPVDARSGVRLPPIDQATAAAIAARLGAASAVAGPAFDYDQWIVHNRFDPLRPFFRLDLHDAAGTQLYLSARTGELAQRTTRRDRGWNWVGAVLHWAYFTPIRSSFTLWDRTVWFLSLVALLVAVAGTILGVIRTLAAQRQRRPALTFYRLRWMRWHHLLGLFASGFVLTWILSGWLSMDHGRLFSRGHAPDAALARYARQSLPAAVMPIRPETFTRYGTARELSFTAVGGSAIVTAWQPGGTVVRAFADGAPLDAGRVAALAGRGIAAAWPGAPVPPSRAVPATDTYALAEGWPATALLFAGVPGVRPDIVVNGTDGQILTVLDRSRKAYAWIYYALHTFNFPGLTAHPLLRRIIVFIPLMFGFAFSITGVVIGCQRLRKTLFPQRRVK